MRLLFNQVATEEFQAGPSELEGLIQRKKQDQFTGMVSSFYASGEQLVFTFYRGKITNNYLCEPKVVTPLAPDGWIAVVVKFNDGLVQVRPLTPSALRLSKLLIETSLEPAVEGVESARVKGLVEQWRTQSVSCIVHLRWESAEGVIYLSRFSDIHDAFMVTTDKFYSGSAFMLALGRWDGQPCAVSRFPDSEATPARQELHLHYAFIELTSGLLANYERFTGRILVASIARDLLVTAEKAGWMISLENGKVNDQTVFSSPEEAAQAYRGLLSVVYRHMSAVLGNKLVQSITYEVFHEKLPKQFQEIITQYSLIPLTVVI